MVRFAAVAALALGLLAPAAAHAKAPAMPPAAVLQLAARVIDASNGTDPSKYAGMYTDDAVVTDENAPYRWSGPDAGVAWFTRVLAVVDAMHARDFHAVAAPASEFQMQGDAAYMVVPVTITAQVGGKPFRESGMVTYTFARTATGWKISSQAWTTAP